MSMGRVASIAVGDKVKYSRHFLQSIGSFTELGHWTGTVKDVRSMGGLKLAEVEWDNGDTMKVNINNLVLVSRLHLERASEANMDSVKVASELIAMAKALIGMEFPTEDAMKKYLKDHPRADKSLHTVKKQEGEKEEEPGKKEEEPEKKSQLPPHTELTPKKVKSIGDKSPEEFASQWGNTKTQAGAHFYNYGSEKQTKDKKFYDEWIDGKGGIRDTAKLISDSLNEGKDDYTMDDLKNLQKLQKHAEAERDELSKKASMGNREIAAAILDIAKEFMSNE